MNKGGDPVRSLLSLREPKKEIRQVAKASVRRTGGTRQGSSPLKQLRYSGRMLAYRIGYGEDAHRLELGRPLLVGGVSVPDAPRGAVAHSDGDAALHALADALLSGLALGDIGQYFPDTDARFKDFDSRVILEHALRLVRGHGYAPTNVALVVTLDRPKLGALREAIAGNIARLLGLAPTEVGVSFKTSEDLASDHVQARATVLLSARP